MEIGTATEGCVNRLFFRGGGEGDCLVVPGNAGLLNDRDHVQDPNCQGTDPYQDRRDQGRQVDIVNFTMLYGNTNGRPSKD